MKLVTAIIKPFKLDTLREQLLEHDIAGITVTEVRGFGRQRGHTEMYRGAEYAVDFLPKIKVEVLSRDDQAERIIDLIIEVCNTGKIGDGKIYVQNLESVIRIRTQETDEQAI